MSELQKDDFDDTDLSFGEDEKVHDGKRQDADEGKVPGMSLLPVLSELSGKLFSSFFKTWRHFN